MATPGYVSSDKNLYENFFLGEEQTFSGAMNGILLGCSDNVVKLIAYLVEQGYKFKFAFYVAVYFCNYHQEEVDVYGFTGFHIYCFIKDFARLDYEECHPYFDFLYDEDPTLRDYFRSQEIFDYEIRFIDDDLDDDGT